MPKDLLMQVYASFNHKIPDEYRRFIKALTRNTSVSALLQCTNDTALEILDQFCEGVCDLRNANNSKKVILLKREIPIVWNSLVDIMKT